MFFHVTIKILNFEPGPIFLENLCIPVPDSKNVKYGKLICTNNKGEKKNLRVNYLLVEIRKVIIFIQQHNIRAAAVTCVIYSPQTTFDELGTIYKYFTGLKKLSRLLQASSRIIILTEPYTNPVMLCF